MANADKTTVTRRQAMRSVAAASVSIAASDAALGGAHPDSKLIDLWHERQRLGRKWYEDGELPEEFWNDLSTAIHEVGKSIVATPAQTLEGLAVKIRLFGAQEIPGMHILTEPLYVGLLADIERLRCIASDRMTTGEDEERRSGGGHA